MLSMPRGTDAADACSARRASSRKAELADHRYVMVLHDHQANPHVHISVRAESKHGKRLNPRKADLHRWRETFAEKLRGWGIEAEASPQSDARRAAGAPSGCGSAKPGRSGATGGSARGRAGAASRADALAAAMRRRPGARSPRRWRHRLTRPTAS